MTVSEHEVIVVGAGISGLTAAWNLKQASVDFKLLEASAHVGGVMRTDRRDGFLLEKGPFNVLVRDAAFEKLLEHYKGKLKPISASGSSGRNRYVLHRSRLCKVPSNALELLTTPLLSTAGKLRLIRGILLSRRGNSVNRSIDEAASRRFGSEVADRLVSALCVGIYAAKSTTLSLDGCFPGIAEMDNHLRSPLLSALPAMFKARRSGSKPRSKRRGLVSFPGGLASLTTLLAEELGDDLMVNCKTRSIKRTVAGFEIECMTDDGHERIIRCKQVALCVGKTAASKLLKSISHTLQSEIESIPTSPVTVLNLGFDRKQIGHPLDGYGFLVPSSESDFPLLGVLWADSVFPHHAPADSRLLRVFISGSHEADPGSKSEAELVENTVNALRHLLHLTGDPTLVDICRWPDSIPHYALDHVQRVARIDEALQTYPGLHLLGNYLHGMSINDCVKNAAEHAAHIIAQLHFNQHQSSKKANDALQRKGINRTSIQAGAHA